jgi:multidrug resistance efflux pump
MAPRINSIIASKRGKIVFAVAIILIVVTIAIGAYWVQQSTRYITTDNARISAPLINVSTPNTCQIISLGVDVGYFVKEGQLVAEVGQPRSFDSSGRQGTRATPLGIYNIESPVAGYVAAIWIYPGAVASPGQSIITIYDSSNVWISANIDETKIDRVKPGQRVEIKVDSLGGKSLKGIVEGIAPATAATFSLLPQQNTSGNFIKVTQVVPVKISIDNTGNALLIPGTSVEVKIDAE